MSFTDYNSTDEVENRLAALRAKRGYSAAELAKRSGVTRQTIYAIEAGDYVPNTVVALRLCHTLDVQVEDLFSLGDRSPGPVRTESVQLLPDEPHMEPGQPVQVCRVDRRLMASGPGPVAWQFPPADGVLAELGKGCAAKVQLFQDDDAPANRLLLAGCDPAISVLARHVRRSGVELVVAHRNSSRSLALLKQGCVHVAGSHLRDEATGESNIPAVRKLFAKNAAAVVSFAVWEEGIVVPKHNPKRIRTIADFARKAVSIVNREPGAGSRVLLDAQLLRAGIPARRVRGYADMAQGHLPAARHVRAGYADACIATRAAARMFGLDFLPLITERYDLVIRTQHLTLPAVQILLDALNRAAFRRELEALGGYDAADAGRRVG